MNTTATAFPDLALNANGDVLLLEYPAALEQFVHEPLTWEFGITMSELSDLYDEEFLFSNIAVYDSINGREGFRINPELTEARYWQLVESAKI